MTIVDAQDQLNDGMTRVPTLLWVFLIVTAVVAIWALREVVRMEQQDRAAEAERRHLERISRVHPARRRHF